MSVPGHSAPADRWGEDVETRFKGDKPPKTAKQRGSANRRFGLKKQRDARKVLERLGFQAGRYASQTGNEETWRLPVRVEVKAGAQVGPVWTRYQAAREQSEQAHPKGDPRPFVFVAMPRGVSYGLVVVRTDDLERVLDALSAT